MKILTFDTALNKTYIALSEDDKIIEKNTIENNQDKYHSAFLIQEIANILKKHNLKMQDIEALGIDIGPGSFTGIRACTTVGRVIAQQIKVSLVPVSSLEILSKIQTKGKTVVILDARRNCVYKAVYENGIEIEAPEIVKFEELNLDNSTIICDEAICNKLEISSINYEAEDYPLNEYLARITYKKLENKEDDYNWAKIKPLYIQPPSVFGAPLQL